MVFNANSSYGCILALLQDDAIFDEAMEEYEQGPAQVQGLAPGQLGRNRRKTGWLCSRYIVNSSGLPITLFCTYNGMLHIHICYIVYTILLSHS